MILALEALRGIAALIVAFTHFSEVFPSTRFAEPGSVLAIFFNGRAAVIFFFVLSGFVLTHKYFEMRDPRLLAMGAIKRLPRLAGPILIMTLSVCLLLRLDGYHYM